MPMFNGFVPRRIQPWIYVVFALLFQLSASTYGGAVAHLMGDSTMMREDALMIVLCGVVGVNMPFPFLFRFKFRFTNQQLLMTAAVVIGVCNVLSTFTESIPVLCAISYVAGFAKLCGTFECMSNIQLWMTPKRDFAIFFPLLYCIVLGDMSLSPWICQRLTYVCQDWHAMQWAMAAAMFALALCVHTLTHPFRFMKPLPLVSLDWLGCALWSAVMLEIIFIFNYGEHYNWLDGQPIRAAACFLPVTLYACIRRMCHIRHPYIAPQAWMYKRLVPLLGLFVVVELVSATPKVLQNAFTGSILHYGWTTTAHLNLVEWTGTIGGCLFVLLWMKVWHWKYTKLFIVGTATLLAYEALMYFSVMPGLPIERLYLPIFCRTFGNAIFFTALTIYLEEVMPFQHFFMGLTMCGLIRNGVVETVCSGTYSFLLRHNVAENLSRGLPYDPSQALLISVKQLFGATCLIAAAVLLVFLLWDLQPVRSTLRRMPIWGAVGRLMRIRSRR